MQQQQQLLLLLLLLPLLQRLLLLLLLLLLLKLPNAKRSYHTLAERRRMFGMLSRWRRTRIELAQGLPFAHAGTTHVRSRTRSQSHACTYVSSLMD